MEIEGVVKTLELRNYKGGFVIVLENFEGVPLSSIVKTHRIHIETFLNMAIQLAETLGHLHQSNIIHKNIKPETV